MIQIEAGSEAFHYLEAAFEDSDTIKVSLVVREDTQQICVKVNERMWTPPMRVTREASHV